MNQPFARPAKIGFTAAAFVAFLLVAFVVPLVGQGGGDMQAKMAELKPRWPRTRPRSPLTPGRKPSPSA